MKKFVYKIYDESGNFLEKYNDIVEVPAFSSFMNSGIGELPLKIPKSVFNFGEGTTIAHNNELIIECFDKEHLYTTTGKRVYSGYLSKYAPTIDQNGSEFIMVTFLGYITQTERFMAEDASGNTTLSYLSQDPSNILKDIIDKYVLAGGKINYSISSVALTGTTVSYTFNTNTVKECLDKIVELSPEGWYYYVDADNIIHFKNRSVTADHTFILGKEVQIIVPEKSVESMTNRVYFTGGDVSGVQFYKKYERNGSISTYGLYAKKYVDGRVTDETTADLMANSILDRGESPETRTTMMILDDNGYDDKGYNIENINVGDTIKVEGYGQQTDQLWDSLIWDAGFWDYDLASISSLVQQIVKVDYATDKVTLEISSKLPNISKRVEDIKRNLDIILTNGNPTAPTT